MPRFSSSRLLPSCSIQSRRPGGLLRPLFLVVLWAAVQSADVSLQSGAQKKILTSFCNIEFKHTFIDPDFSLLSNTPIEASREIQAICPFTKFSCCTVNELKDFTSRFLANMGVLTQYFEKIKTNIGSALQVDHRKVLEVFEKINAKVGENESITNGQCRYGFKGTKADARLLLLNLNRDVKRALTELDNVRSLIKRFYSGFACSVCDLQDHQFVEVNDKDNATSMTFDPSICETVFRIRLKHYRVAKYVMGLFDLVNSILCMSKRSTRNFIYFMRIRQELVKKTQVMEECAAHSDNDLSEISPKCLEFCGEKLFFQMYVDNFDLLTLSNFVKTFMETVRLGRKWKDARREIQSSLYFAVDFSFKESSKRRSFYLHQPKFQNLFSSEQFKRKFRSNAINFLNKAPVLSEG